jgi:hypothetical protein
MAIFCLMRKQFLDRVFRLDELGEMTEMLVRWYLLRAGDLGRSGQSRCEAFVYAFARPNGQAIQKSLALELPGATFDASDPDELRISGESRAAGDSPDLSVWRVVLSEPKLEHTCVLLRLTITGPLTNIHHTKEEGTTTFIFCGAPSAGAILLKAVWTVGFDQSMQLVYRGSAWKPEVKLLEAYDLYHEQCNAGISEDGAQWARNLFGREAAFLFNAQSTERKFMRRLRKMAEMPDDRGPGRFARRLAPPLSGAIGLILIAIMFRDSWPTVIACGVVAIPPFISAANMLWGKAQRVIRYHTAMRHGLGQLYSAPVDREQIDLSDDKTSSLLKCSAEIAALGAQHICDVRVTSARGVRDGNRVYTLGNAAITIGLLRRTEKYFYFPARPVLFITTRFKDGRRHYTVNTPRYRKQSNSKVTGRCLLNQGGVDEMLALHDRHVDKLIAAGAVPVSSPTSPAQVFEQLRQEYEESRQAWQKSPYSWGDALHDAFKVCRREYLAD